MMLADLQRRFLATIAAADTAAEDSWPKALQPGVAVYRNAYRARLVEGLSATYPKCLAWAGESAFGAAARHHAILHPPTGWTLDALGAGFDATLSDLFPHDPELAELAWLEWRMNLAFTAPDRPFFDGADFAAATDGFCGDDWAALVLTIAPELAVRAVAHDVPAIWAAIAQDADERPATRLAEAASIAVWRLGLEPRFRLLDDGEAAALALAADGARFAEICARAAPAADEGEAAARCGAWLGRWIVDGLVADIGMA